MMIKDYKHLMGLKHIHREQQMNAKSNQIKSKYKMINFNDYANENKTEHNSNWPYTPDHPYRILIIGGSGSGKLTFY